VSLYIQLLARLLRRAEPLEGEDPQTKQLYTGRFFPLENASLDILESKWNSTEKFSQNALKQAGRDPAGRGYPGLK
jgi:hypothetical protein